MLEEVEMLTPKCNKLITEEGSDSQIASHLSEVTLCVKEKKDLLDAILPLTQRAHTAKQVTICTFFIMSHSSKFFR